LRILKNIIYITLFISFTILIAVIVTQKKLETKNDFSLNQKNLNKIKLIDYENNILNGEDLFKKPSIIFFGFTHCPDVCPLTLTKLFITLKKVKNNDKLILYFVSLDPERDSPSILKNYLDSFNGKIIGLTGDTENLKHLTNFLGVKYSKRKTKDNYTIDHSSSSLLIFKNKVFDRILFNDDLDISLEKIKLFLSQTS